MAIVFQVAESIYQIETEASKTPSSCSVYFITDQKTALIEVGPASVAPAILEGVHQLGYNPEGISYIIATHIHVDHGGGLGYLARQLPQTQMVVHEKGVRYLIDPTRLIESTKQVFGDNFEDKMGPILPVPEERILVVKGGEAFSLGHRELRIIYTPGHAPHHICIYDTKSQGLFCGEALGLRYANSQIVLPSASPPSFDLDLALETIKKLKGLAPDILFYSHYGVTKEVAKSIQSVEETTRACGDFTLEAMRAGQDLEQITKGLESYISEESRTSEAGSPWRGGLAWLLASGYFVHFKKKGLA